MKKYLMLFLLFLIALPSDGRAEFLGESNRFQTALDRANDALANGNLFWGKVWLRQAYQAAPNESVKSDVEQVLLKVSAASPLAVKLRFSVTPSNNVNDGSETDFIWINGFPFELDAADRKISGVRSEASLSLSYRVSQSSNFKNELLGDVFFRNVWIDGPEEADSSSSVVGSDFNITSVAVGYRTTVLAFPTLGATEFTGMIGQTWRGGLPYNSWVDVRSAQSIMISRNSVLRPSVSLRKTERRDGSVNDSFGVLAAVDWQIANRDSYYTFGIFVEDVSSDSALLDSRTSGATITGSFREFMGIVPSAQLKFDYRDFTKWAGGLGGRTDKSISAEIAFEFTAIDYFGFSPVFNFGYRKVDSTVDIFDRQGATVGLAVSSRF